MTNKKVAQVSWLMRTGMPMVVRVYVLMRTKAQMKMLVLQVSRGLQETRGEEKEHRPDHRGQRRGPSPE